MEHSKNMETFCSNMNVLDNLEVLSKAKNKPREKNIPDIIASKHKRISIVQNSHICKSDVAESLIIDPEFEEIDSIDKHKVHDMSKQLYCQIDQPDDTPLPNQYNHSPKDQKYTPNNTPSLYSQDQTNSNLNETQNSPKSYLFQRMNNAETLITKVIKNPNNKCDVSLSSVFKPKLGTPTFNRSVIYTGGSKAQDNKLTKHHIVFTPSRITNTISVSMNQVNSDRPAKKIKVLKPKTMNNPAVTKTPNINRGRYIADNLITSDRYQGDNKCELNGFSNMVSHSPWKSLHRQYLFANLKAQNHPNNEKLLAQNRPKFIPGSAQNEMRLREVNSNVTTSVVSHRPSLSMLKSLKVLDTKTMKPAVEVDAINTATPTGVDIPKSPGQKTIYNSTDFINGECDKSKTQKDMSPLVHYLENDLEDHTTVNERYRFRKDQVPAIQIIQKRIKEKFIKYQEQKLQNSKLEVNEEAGRIKLDPTAFSQLETDSPLPLKTNTKYMSSSSPKVEKLNQLNKDEPITSDKNLKDSFLKKNIETAFRKEPDQNPIPEFDDKTCKALNIETSFQQLENSSSLENGVLPSQTVNSPFERNVPHLAYPGWLNGSYKLSDSIPTFQVDELNLDEKIKSVSLHSVSSTKIAPNETDLSPAQLLNSQLKLELCLDFTKSLCAIDTKLCSKARILYKRIKNCEEKMKLFQTWQKGIRKEQSQLEKKITDKLEKSKWVEQSDTNNHLSKVEYSEKVFPQIEQMLNSLQTKIDNLELQKHESEDDAKEVKKLESLQNIRYLQKLEAFDNELQSLFDLRFAEMESELIEKSDKLLENMISKYNEVTQEKVGNILKQDNLQQGDEKCILKNAQVAMNCENQLSDPETKLNKIEKILIQMRREWIKSSKNQNNNETEHEKVSDSADEQASRYNFKSEEQPPAINNQEVKKLRGLIHHLVNKLEGLETLVEQHLAQQSKSTSFFESKELTIKADMNKETSLQKESTSRNPSDSTTSHLPSHFQDTNHSGCSNDLKPLAGKISANSAGKNIELCTENNKDEKRNTDLESNVENKPFSNLDLSKVECTPNITDTKLSWKALVEHCSKIKLNTETMEQEPERRSFSSGQYSEVGSCLENARNSFSYNSQNSQFGKKIGTQTKDLSLEEAFQDLETSSSNIPVIDCLSDDEENVGSVMTEFKKKFHKGLLSIVQAGTSDKDSWKRKSSSLDYSERESDYLFDNQCFGDRENKFYQEKLSSISSDDTTFQKGKFSEFLKSREKQALFSDSKQCNLLLKKEYQPIKIRPLEIAKEHKNTIHCKNIVAPFSSNAGSKSSNVSKVSIRTTIENNSFSIAKSSHCDDESLLYLSPTTAGFGPSKTSKEMEVCNVVGSMNGLEPVPRFEKIADFVTHSTPIHKSFSNSCAISDESDSCSQTFCLREAVEARQKFNVHKEQSITEVSKRDILWQANFGPSMDTEDHDDSYSKNLQLYKFRSLSSNSDWFVNNRLDFEMQIQDENSHEKSRRSVDDTSGYSLHGLPLAFQDQLNNNPKNIVVTPTPRPKSNTVKRRLLSDAYCEKLKKIRVPKYAKRKSFDNVSLNFRTECTVQPGTVTTTNTFDSYITSSTDDFLQKSRLEKMQRFSNVYPKRDQQKAKLPKEESDSCSNNSTRIWSNNDRIQKSRLLLQNDECKDPYGENFRLRKSSSPNWNGSLWTKQQDSIECRSYEENTKEFSIGCSTSVSDFEQTERFASIKRNNQVGFSKQGMDLWDYRMKSNGGEKVECHIDFKKPSSDSSDEYYYGEDDHPFDESLNEIESVIIEDETDRLPSPDKLDIQKTHDDSDLERIDCNCKNIMQTFQF